MSSWNNISKTSTASFSNVSKNASTWNNLLKAGSGYEYDSNLEYDQDFDPLTGLPVNYDALGTLPTWTNVSKN